MLVVFTGSRLHWSFIRKALHKTQVETSEYLPVKEVSLGFLLPNYRNTAFPPSLSTNTSSPFDVNSKLVTLSNIFLY